MKKYNLGSFLLVWAALFAVTATLHAGIFTDLHDFTDSTTDGSYPNGVVLNNGQLLGVVSQGGSASSGLLFTMSTNGTSYTDFHDFTGQPDGQWPNELLLTNGVIYGTTYKGGITNFGTIFKMNVNGSGYTVLHSFNINSSADGSFPHAALTIGGATLYGVCYQGGISNSGTLFKIDTSGANFTVLHNFTNGPDGADPFYAQLLLNDATLYGTTSIGGSNNVGTVFKLNTNGTDYKVIYAFSNAPAASMPYVGLVLNNNTLYGTTLSGGLANNGAVFQLATNGTGFAIIHSFTNSAGFSPQTALLVNNNLLYGATASGGTGGYGTIYQLSLNGANFTVLKNFTNSLTAANPKGPLVMNGNTIYGVCNAGGPTGGGSAFRLVLAPAITAQPQSAAVSSGSSASFSVTAADELPVTYQWYFNTTTVLSGQTGSTLTIGSVNNGNTGNYTVVVTDVTGSVTSSPAVLSIATSPTVPVITAQPQSQTKNIGDSVTFTVTATSGSGSPTYQWYFNTNTVLSGQTGNSLTLTGLTTGNAGAYTVVVGNTAGSVTSSPAILTVVNPSTVPVITGQPQSQTKNIGDSATFTVTATSNSGSPTYQWYYNTNTVLSGQTGNSLTLTGLTTGNAGAYTVVVGNTVGSVTSSPAILTVVNPPPSINTQPQSLNVTNGDSATFSVTASGNGTLFYQWYFNTNTAVAGETNSAYTIPVVFTNNAGYYTVVVTNLGGAVMSSAALLTVSTNSLPVISDQSHDMYITNGDVANFFVAASGRAPLHYQWYTNKVNNLTTYLPFLLKTNYTLATTAYPGKSIYLVCVVTNSLGKATSNPAFLTVVTTPLIITNPQPATVLLGNTTNFSVAVLATTSLQWYSNSVNTAIGAPLAGQTASTYTVTGTAADNGKYYTVVATSSLGKATSSPALLTVQTVLPVPTITLQPLSATITNGGSVTFTSAATGTGTLGYQWLYQTNLLIPGATGTSLTFSNANQPGIYSMMVTNNFGAATSSPALLTVIGRPILLGSTFDPASGSYVFSYVNLAGSTNRLQATTNLADPNAWQSIATNYMATNGIWQFTDPNTAHLIPVRFYRFSSP